MSEPSPDFVLRGHAGAVNCVRFVNGNVLASGSVDGELRVWNLENRRSDTVVGHSHSVTAVEGMHSGGTLVSSGRDEYVKLWDPSLLATPKANLNTGGRHFCNIAVDKFDKNSNIIVSPSVDDQRLLVWDTRTETVVSSIETDKKKGMVTNLLMATSSAASSNTALLIGYEDGSLSIMDFRVQESGSSTSTSGNTSTRSVLDMEVHDKQPLMTMDMSHDGKTIITGGADQSVHRISIKDGGSTTIHDFSSLQASLSHNNNDSNSDTDTDKPCSEVGCAKIPIGGTGGLRIRPDNRICVSGHWDSTVRIFDLKKQHVMKPLAVLHHHRENIFAIDFGPSSTAIEHTFASGSKDGTVALWSVYSKK